MGLFFMACGSFNCLLPRCTSHRCLKESQEVLLGVECTCSMNGATCQVHSCLRTQNTESMSGAFRSAVAKKATNCSVTVVILYSQFSPVIVDAVLPQAFYVVGHEIKGIHRTVWPLVELWSNVFANGSPFCLYHAEVQQCARKTWKKKKKTKNLHYLNKWIELRENICRTLRT